MWAGIEELSAELADFYRDLHQHPELSLQEHRTARLVADALWPLGFEVTEQVGGTGVVGLLRNGDGPVVMLRADFDALPVEEKTGLPYASTARARGQDGEEVLSCMPAGMTCMPPACWVPRPCSPAPPAPGPGLCS
jgi:hippurate hydrolase